MKTTVEFVSIHGLGWSGKADLVVARGEGGELGVGHGHSPLVTTLKPGDVRILDEGRERLYYVAGGIMEVQPSLVTILADEVVPAEKLDLVEIEKKRAEAEKVMKELSSSDLEFVKARIDLIKMIAQHNTLKKRN